MQPPYAHVEEAAPGERAGGAPEDRFRALLEAAPDAMIIVGSDGNISLANAQMAKLFGYEPRELVGQPVELLIPERFRERHVKHRHGFYEAPRTRPMGTGLELFGRRKDGSEFPVEISLSPMRTGSDLAVTAAIRDITARKEVENELRASLKEKEVLLKEIHHRVKNNLQIVTSMLNLQMGQIKDPQARALFRESQARVRSIAYFHEKLYQSKNLANIEMADYLHGLAKGLFAAYGVNTAYVGLSVDVDNIPLSVDAAIACGLIVNELVSNALKHAFPAGRKGHLHVALKKDGQDVQLRVCDDGVGLPAGFDVSSSGSLGLRLVEILTEQLQGTLRIDRSGGTRFVVRFNLGEAS